MKLLKFNFNQITILNKNQMELFLKNYKFIALIISFTLLNLIINGFGLFVIGSDNFSPDTKLMTTNIFIAIISILIIIQTIYLKVNCFATQLSNNIHTTELRYGYQIRNIYRSRIIFILTFSLFYLLIIFIISSSFFGFGKSQNGQASIYLYRLYISAFGWYVSLRFFSIVITVILTKFLSEASASIIASVLGVIFILIPSISGLTSNYFNYDTTNSYYILVTEDYRKNLYQDLKDDETFQKIIPEFAYLYYQSVNSSNINLSTEELLAGPKLWKWEDETQIQNYQQFYQNISKVLDSQNQITSWDSIPETSEFHYYEPFEQLFNRLLSNQTLKEYHHLFKVMEKYTNNFVTLKQLEIIYTPVVNFDLLGKFYQAFLKNIDEYFFIKTLNSLFLRLVEPSYLTSVYVPDGNITIDQIKKRVKKDQIANMFNPLRHFNLMFQSIDYNNKFLFNLYGQKQYVYSNVPNITFDFSGSDIRDLDAPLKLKQAASVAGIASFYWILGLLLLWLSFLGFNKKIKK